jgi:hypothetical protein
MATVDTDLAASAHYTNVFGALGDRGKLPISGVGGGLSPMSWSNVILRATFDAGATDLSLRARPLTAAGAPVLSAAAAKFGAQGMVPSAGGYSYPVEAADAWGNRDFCMEAWVYNTQAQPNGAKVFEDSAGAVYVDLLDSLGQGTYVRAAAWKPGFANLVQVNSHMISNTFYLDDATMYHIAFNRYGDRFNLFVNGVVRGWAIAPEVGMTLAHNTPRYIGSGPAGANPVQGRMDDVRITLGHSVYGNTDFTPPAQALPTA